MKKSFVRWMVGILLVLVLIGAVGALALTTFRHTLARAQAVRASIAEAQRLIAQERDFFGAAQQLHRSVFTLGVIAQTFARVQYVRLIPWVDAQFNAGSALVEAAQIATDALASSSAVVGKLYEPIKRHGKVPIGSLPVEERVALLQQVYEAVPQLQKSQEALTSAQELLTAIDRNGLVVLLSQEIESADKRLMLITRVLRDGIPLFQVMPRLLGFPKEQSYLLALQNSAEMRPAGGFLGTYGLLTLTSGHVSAFITDDVYNLDRFVPPVKRPPSPDPIAHYLEQPKFYLRDANWNPDFFASAQTMLQFYQNEHDEVCRARHQPIIHDSCIMIPNQLDGVIALMPGAISPLLALTGPITVAGQTFTADNLTDLLEYQVEIGFTGKGIPRPQRKEIISELGHALITRVLELPVEKWIAVLHLIRTALDEKQILLYAQDPALQARIVQSGWGGTLAAPVQDYLAVFDANLFSLKTDPYVPRSIFYAVRKESIGFTGEVEIVYSYPRSGPAWKTKGYRSFTRVYVPKGSILVDASGVMAEEGSSKPGSITIEQTHAHTVFGAFIAVEVGEIKRLRFKYRLPDAVAETVAHDGYSLLVQKQAGTIGHDLTVRAEFDKVARLWDPTGLQVSHEGNRLTWQTSLRRDQNFRVKF